jgi:GTP-binding protein
MEVTSAKYIISSPTYKDCPPPDKPEFAFIGRSNVGKSSLINMLTNRRDLAKISATPGKTRLINHFEAISFGKKSWYLVDLPGYGYATVSQKARHNFSNMIESYIRKRENLVCLFVLVDSRLGPQPVDLEFINKLGEWGTPFVVVFTKADKKKPGAVQANVDSFMQALKETWELLPPFFLTSAKDKTGREEVLDYISDLVKSFRKL